MAGVATFLGLTAMQWLIVSVVLTVISIAISLYQMLSYKAPQPPVPTAQTISSIPTAEQGKGIPIVFGTRIVSQPNVVWWGLPHSIKNQVDASELRG